MSNISKRLEQQADLLFNNVAGWERNALRRIGRRVKDIKSLSYADLQAINNAAIVKQDVNAILKELATLTGQSSIEVKRIYAEMIDKQHEENKVLYDYRRKQFIPLADNKPLQAIVNAYARTTAGTMVNLSMTKAKRLGFADKNNNFVPLEKNFKQVLDKAVMSITNGTGDVNSEMRGVLKELGGSGLRVDYGGGVTRRLDTMVRQNLLWGAKQASVTYNEMIGEELGCDGIEIDWHSNPRPRHEFMQGKQYVLGKARIINGKYFESADDALSALSDYGCLHFKTPIICGVSEPRYSPEELASLNKQNKRTFEIEGKQLSGYQCKQVMRRLETEARKTKDQIELLRASGDNEGVRQLKSKLKSIEDKYNLVANGSGIKAQPQKMSIAKSNYKKNTTKNSLQNKGKSGIIKTNQDAGRLAKPYPENDVPSRVREYLSKTQNYGDILETKQTISKADICLMSRQTGVEYAYITIGERHIVIRGNVKGVAVPKDIFDEMRKLKGRLECHSHPYIGDLQPSAEDIAFAREMYWQKEFEIVSPDMKRATYTKSGVIEVSNLQAELSPEEIKIIVELFGGV